MYFDSISQFLAMGGYGFYVWTAFGATYLTLFIILFSSMRRKKQLFKAIIEKADRKIRIKAAQDQESTL